MKRTLQCVLVVSLIAMLSACSCEEEPPKQVEVAPAVTKEVAPAAEKAPEVAPVAEKAPEEAAPTAEKAPETPPIVEKAPEEAPVAEGSTPPGDILPEDIPAPGDDDPNNTTGIEGMAEVDEEGAGEVEEKPIEIIDPETGEKVGELKPDEKERLPGDLSDDEKRKLAEQIDKGIPADSIEPFEAGDLYEGPPSKAIVGTWKIHVPKSSIPKDMPEEDLKALTDLGDITMKFDGNKATVSAGTNKESFVYKVTSEEGITLQLSAKKDKAEEIIMVTFYDMDNIILTENRYPGPARGARVK